MKRYFFHLEEGAGLTVDEEGEECLTLDDVRTAAVRSARSVMCADLSMGSLCMKAQIRVTDAAGSDVLTVPFREAVRINNIAARS